MFARYLADVWQIMLELSPSLLLGLLIAGLMHVYLPSGLIHRGLNRPDLRSVMRASLLGVPLPLCSCGVIPTALGLRREGASQGAATAFLISTPQTGADSLLVSAAFLGWPFAIFKLVAAFFSGLVGGVLANRLTRDTALSASAASATGSNERRREGMAGVLRYAVRDLLGAIDLWLIAGVLAAALVTTLTPADFFAGQPWSQGLLGMLVVLAISLPLYVCTTASVPIAASLIAAGMPAGSALVFLMAGPATNLATIGAVYRALGARVLSIYLGTVIVMSVLFGLLFESLLADPSVTMTADDHGAGWIGVSSAMLLIVLLLWLQATRVRARLAPRQTSAQSGDLLLEVQGMTCAHCVRSVKHALEELEAVDEATPDLSSGRVHVRGGHLDASALASAVARAGFQVKGTRSH